MINKRDNGLEAKQFKGNGFRVDEGEEDKENKFVEIGLNSKRNSGKENAVSPIKKKNSIEVILCLF